MKPKVIKQRRDTRVLSPAVAAAAEARALRAPLVVSGISPGKLVTITPTKFDKLDVDPAYQRGETHMVGEIVRALQAGGIVLDPVTLCRRPWDKMNGDTLWIVDGHQRVCAHQEMGREFQALVHESESLEAEKLFFLSLNNRRAVGTDIIVKSWPGPSADLVKKVNADADHPLHDRVSMTQGGQHHKISASILVKGLLPATAGVEPHGAAAQNLARLDNALKKGPSYQSRAEHYLRLVGYVFPKGHLSILVAVSLGLVAFERWQKGASLPPMDVMNKLRDVKWRDEVPAPIKKFQPVIVETIKRIWKVK